MNMNVNDCFPFCKDEKKHGKRRHDFIFKTLQSHFLS